MRGAIPTQVVARLAEQKQLALSAIKKSGGAMDQLYDEHKRHFAQIDHVLDTTQHGPVWLKQPSIAAILKTSCTNMILLNYELLAYFVVANHVHVVIDTVVQLDGLNPNENVTTANYTQLHIALKYTKGGSARLANQLLDRTGAFWQPESYNHYVRNAPELGRIIDYTLQNPVKAGLVGNWQDWPHSFLSERFK